MCRRLADIQSRLSHKLPIRLSKQDVPRVLNPKSGDYGDTSGTWQFTIAGSTAKIKAKISDKNFLSQFSSGEIRFHKKDILRVLLKEKQTIKQLRIPGHVNNRSGWM